MPSQTVLSSSQKSHTVPKGCFFSFIYFLSLSHFLAHLHHHNCWLCTSKYRPLLSLMMAKTTQEEICTCFGSQRRITSIPVMDYQTCFYCLSLMYNWFMYTWLNQKIDQAMEKKRRKGRREEEKRIRLTETKTQIWAMLCFETRYYVHVQQDAMTYWSSLLGIDSMLHP